MIQEVQMAAHEEPIISLMNCEAQYFTFVAKFPWYDRQLTKNPSSGSEIVRYSALYMSGILLFPWTHHAANYFT